MAFLCSLFRLRREEQIHWWCGRLKNSSDIIALNLIITSPSASYWLPVCLGLLSCLLVTYFPVSVHSEAFIRNEIISKRERVVSLAQLCSGYTHTKMNPNTYVWIHLQWHSTTISLYLFFIKIVNSQNFAAIHLFLEKILLAICCSVNLLLC